MHVFATFQNEFVYALITLSGNRHAVGKQGPITLDLKSSAFDPKEKVWTRFPPEGSKYTPPHSSCDFKWKDYCPQVFRLVITPMTYLCVMPAFSLIHSHQRYNLSWIESQDTTQVIQG